jgi:hypothetical protein
MKMSAATVFELLVAALIVGFVVGFFVGGKHKAGLMAKAAQATLTASDIIKDAGKKL